MQPPPDADYVLTILAPALSEAHLATLIEMAAKFGLSRIGQRLLSETEPGDSSDQQAATATPAMCLELHLIGTPTDEPALRGTLLDFGTTKGIDISLQPATLFQHPRGLIVFDLDSTLIQNEVIDELARVAGVADQVTQITQAAMNGDVPFKDSLIKRVSLLEGLSVECFTEISELLQLAAGAERLLAITRKLGMRSAIVTGGFRIFAEPIQQRLGIDTLYAHELEIAHNHLTGRVSGTIIDGEEKRRLLLKLATNAGLTLEQTVAVGDGANDIPMLAAAGLGIAFHAKPATRRHADCTITQHDFSAIPYLLGLSTLEQRRLISHHN